ncbi:hypothetical protein AGMMS50230_17950 [Spirochaetia bacterium]|nr:hypothetical protein AGMMS50230_17950 [Spirochaetia bacterium]
MTDPALPASNNFAGGKLIYIVIPRELHQNFAHHGDFTFDPAVPLPVELPPGTDTFDPAELSIEMILSGLLQDLAAQPEEEKSGYYRQLVNGLRPDTAGALLDAATVKARAGDYETALEIFRLLDGLCPGNPVLLLNRALALEARAEGLENTAGENGPMKAESAFAEAESAYEKALVRGIPDTLFNAGFFYQKRGDYTRAAECLLSYLDAVENNETAPGTEDSETGVENSDTEDSEKRAAARELLDEIRNNGLDDPAFKEGIALIRRGEEEQGILKAREFLERCPNAGRGWFILGWGLRRLCRWQDGAACFEKALELGTANADTRNELAICRMENGELDEARGELEKALYLDPDNVKIISNMGILAMKEGDDDRAAAFFRTVLALEPEDPVAQAFFGT